MNNPLTDWVATMMNQLVRQGVTDVVISPGSRSTPLAMAAYLHPTIRHHIIVDERSAAFFALGLTRSTDSVRPVALICTSGTAATNYFSAIAEAFISQLPLIVLTTDRPYELRDVGAPQAINQVRLYGEHVKASIDLPVPAEETMAYMAQSVFRLARLSMNAPFGPVHLNVPFREPLLPDVEALKEKLQSDTVHRDVTYLNPSAEDITTFLEAIRVTRLAFVVGPYVPEAWLDAIATTARTYHIPLFADPLSGMRRDPLALTNYDTWLASDHREEWLPDTIVRFGAAPVSKRLNQWLTKTTQLVIEQHGSHRDPTNHATILYGDARSYLNEVVTAYDLGYQHRLSLFEHIVESAKTSLDGEIALTQRLTTSSLDRLFVSNSMPIRDIDTTLSAGNPLRVFANRGANGIDGVISSALGNSYDTERSALLIGDLAFYHDSNALQLLKTYPRQFSIIVVNNNGGGIFSFLPQAASDPQLFEDLFGTPLELNIRGFADTYGLTYRLVERADQLDDAIDAGVHLIEFPSDRAHNVAAHRAWTSHVCDQLVTENES